MSDKFKVVGMRLFKGFVSGAVTSMIMVSVVAPSSWETLGNIVNILSVAGIFGGINGTLLALQKWYSYTD
jgi:hypothetical protein